MAILHLPSRKTMSSTNTKTPISGNDLFANLPDELLQCIVDRITGRGRAQNLANLRLACRRTYAIPTEALAERLFRGIRIVALRDRVEDIRVLFEGSKKVWGGNYGLGSWVETVQLDFPITWRGETRFLTCCVRTCD